MSGTDRGEIVFWALMVAASIIPLLLVRESDSEPTHMPDVQWVEVSVTVPAGIEGEACVHGYVMRITDGKVTQKLNREGWTYRAEECE